MDIINELVSVIVRLVIAGAGTAFMAYGIPYLKKIGVYKLVQIAVRAAEKLGYNRRYRKGRQEEIRYGGSGTSGCEDHSDH